MESHQPDVDAPVRQVGHHSVGARIEPETGQDHPDGPDGFSPPASVPFLEVPNPLDAVLVGSLGQKGSDFRIRQGLQVGAVVQYLGDGGPRELLALELEDHQSTVLFDAQKVNKTGLDRNLSANQREPAHQHVGVRHQHGFQHLFRFNPLGEAEFGSGARTPVDLPDADVSLHAGTIPRDDGQVATHRGAVLTK